MIDNYTENPARNRHHLELLLNAIQLQPQMEHQITQIIRQLSTAVARPDISHIKSTEDVKELVERSGITGFLKRQVLDIGGVYIKLKEELAKHGDLYEPIDARTSNG